MHPDEYSEFDAPRTLIELFRRGDYSSQGHSHIDTCSHVFGSDLLRASDVLTTAAKRGEIVSERNYTAPSHPFYHDVDYVVGSPKNSPQRRFDADTIFEDPVERVWLAIDFETLASSVGKNWTNRGKDIHSFYLGVYDSASLAATGCFVILNTATKTLNPTEVINGFNQFNFSRGSLAQRLDALTILPVKYDSDAPEKTELDPDYVQPGHELHYDTFLTTLSDALELRFEGEYRVTPESIQSVLSEIETDVLEFKQSIPDRVDTIKKEVAAFANHDGGVLLLGVDDDGSPIGLDDIRQTEERIRGLLENLPSSIIDSIESARVDGEDILIINVNRATEAPIEFKNNFPVRRGTTVSYLTGRDIVDTFPREKY